MDENMAEGFEFDVEGLEELEKDLEKAVGKCPVQVEATLKKLARNFKKSAQKRAEVELLPHERKEEEKKKSINKKWGSKIVDESVGMTALIWNSARHFHLIENGHNLVKGGRIIGFVSGKHIMEKTKNEFKEIVPKTFEKMVEDILKESDLN